jgi:RNHCP domain-containing protein
MKKVIENFICELCGEKVIGEGTTDHCPKCLVGKHVDEETPGDRLSDCKGLMRAIRSSYRNGEFRIYYKCQNCSHDFWVDAAKNDNRDLLIELSAE